MTKKTKHTVSSVYHCCLGLSLWSNKSTGLKILHKGEPSALSSHILRGRPPARREVRLLLILRSSAGRKEVQSKGGGDVQMKAGNTLQTRRILRVRSTQPRKQHTFAHMHRNTSSSTHVNTHVPSLAVMQHTSQHAENNMQYLSQAGRPLWTGTERSESDLSEVWHWSWHFYWSEQMKCSL